MALKGLVVERGEITLEPVTPIHVWSGEDYVVGLDLISLGGGVYCVVDLERATPEALEKISGVKDLSSALARMVKNGVLACRRRIRSRVPLRPGGTVKRLSSQGVPGSELKGYIRTAVMYDMLSGIGKGAIQLLRGSVKIRGKPKAWGSDLEGKLLKAPRPKKVKGYVDALQALLVSDPEQRELKSEILELRAVEGPRLSPVASQYVEAIVSGELMFRVSIVRPGKLSISQRVREHEGALRLLSTLTLRGIASALRAFGTSLLDHELSRAKGLGLKLYVEILERLREECSDNCMPARIGFMTGHEAKTLMLLVRDIDPGLHQRVTSALSRIYGKAWDSRTLKLVRYGGEWVGVGWCKLHLRS